MAANDFTLRDGDQEFSDWIEIHNPTGAAIDLGGYFLTDKAGNLNKWEFPAQSLAAGGYLIVFASNKNRRIPGEELHTNFTLSSDGEYVALVAPDETTVLSGFSPGFPPLAEDEAYGRSGGNNGYLNSPTPGAANVGVTEPGPLFTEVTDSKLGKLGPVVPGTPIMITASVEAWEDLAPVASVKMTYRRMFGSKVTVMMRDDGTGGDVTAGDGTYTATIPGSAVAAGEMVRWKFEATDTTGRVSREPAFRDPEDWHEYYGTVGEDASITSNLPVFQWFVEPGEVEAVSTRNGGRSVIYFLGELYDNVFFNLHGQSTAGPLFPKKSHNMDFNRTQRFRWSDEQQRVKDMDILTNWADKSKLRHPLAYEVLREAGVATHMMFSVRVQRNGSFFGIVDMVEDAEESYLERAGLNPEGAIYKMYNRFNSPGDADEDSPERGAEKKTRRFEGHEDIQALLTGVTNPSSSRRRIFLYDNLDIPKTINLLASYMLLQITDFGHKNYYLYRDTGKTDEWAILPWDIDLCLGHRWNSTETYFDEDLPWNSRPQVLTLRNGLVEAIYEDNDLEKMLFRRMRTLMDKYLQPPGTPVADDWLAGRMDAIADILDPVGNTSSDADLDFLTWGMWDETGTRIHPDDPALGSPETSVDSMRGEINRIKTDFLPARRDFIYNNWVSASRIPEAQPNPVTDPGAVSPTIGFGTIEFSPDSGNQDEEYIILTNQNITPVDISGWQLAGGIQFTFEPGTVIPGRGTKPLHVSPDITAFRARATSPKAGGRIWVEGPYQGNLSSLGETIELRDTAGNLVNSITYEGDPSDQQLYLRVTEVMYHPEPDGQAEYIELVNTSSSITLDLNGVTFVDGINFSFTGSAITSLGPGERVLVVRNVAAFTNAYGGAGASRIAGSYGDDNPLSNGGDTIDLEDSTGATIVKFTYGDNRDPAWPAAADGGNYSLVLEGPAASDPNVATNWRTSTLTGGNPGGVDSVSFPGDPGTDSDGDGLLDILEWAMSGSLTGASQPEGAVEQLNVGGVLSSYLVFRCRRYIPADGIGFSVEISDDLGTWSGSVILMGEENHGDGTATVTYRSLQSVAGASSRMFMRAGATYLP